MLNYVAMYNQAFLSSSRNHARELCRTLWSIFWLVLSFLQPYFFFALISEYMFWKQLCRSNVSCLLTHAVIQCWGAVDRPADACLFLPGSVWQCVMCGQAHCLFNILKILSLWGLCKPFRMILHFLAVFSVPWYVSVYNNNKQASKDYILLSYCRHFDPARCVLIVGSLACLSGRHGAGWKLVSCMSRCFLFITVWSVSIPHHWEHHNAHQSRITEDRCDDDSCLLYFTATPETNWRRSQSGTTWYTWKRLEKDGETVILGDG